MTDIATSSGGIVVLPEHAVEKAREDARARIAYWVIGVYLFLLVLNIGIPVVLYLLLRDPSQPFGLSDLKDLVSMITGALAGLLGILGFVVGYYFKSLDNKKQE